ncbi:hypothetical protein R70723_18900 [Paenibacillus sp. FSL R7-0273]|nr:hypothetical protein R70723_18900 [Paenibacillus sp. FSL R7-0273]OMF94715.1 hypothetical protein BK144_09355 [Paenibacillus sp. FSL R7-0273]
MGMQNVTGISPVQVISAYGGTQSDVSSMEKQRDRLMMELEKVNAAPGGAATVNRREQLQRQIRLIEVQLAQKIGSTASAESIPSPAQNASTLGRTEWKGAFRGIGMTDPRTATVDSEGHFNALI